MTKIPGFALTLLAMSSPTQAQQTTAPEAPRPAYTLIFSTTTDSEAFGIYTRSLLPIYEKYHGYYLANGSVGRGVRVLEGEFKGQSIILAKFLAMDGPNTFWWSPEYRQSVEIRKEASTLTALKLTGTQGGDLGKPSGPPAYLIAMYIVTDREKLTRYADVARPLLQAAGGTFIATGARKDIELLEGNFGNVSINIVQFPSLAALRAFYEDPVYQRMIPIRRSAGEYTVLEVEGVRTSK